MPSFFRGHKKARSFGETAPLLICCCNHITGRAAGPAPFSDKFLNVFFTVCSAGEGQPCGRRFWRRGHVLPEIFCDAAVSQMFCGAAGDPAGRGELFRPGWKRWNFFQRSSLGEVFPAAMKRTGPAHFSDGAGRGNLRQNLLNTSARNRSPDMFARRGDVQKFHGAAWERPPHFFAPRAAGLGGCAKIGAG